MFIMDKYQEKLDSIKSKRIGHLQRLQYGGYFVGVLMFSYLLMIFGYKGLFVKRGTDTCLTIKAKLNLNDGQGPSYA